MKNLRVLHVHIALYQPYLMVKALRHLGHQADHLVFENESIKWLIHDADFFIGNARKPGNVIQALRFFLFAIKNYDIFHFHSLPGFVPVGWSKLLDRCVGLDLSLLKRLGKKIIFSHWGCHDGRTPSGFKGYENGRVCRECNQYQGMCTDEYVRLKGEPQLKYADAIINTDPDQGEYNRSAFYMHGAIDLAFWNPDEKIPAKFLIAKPENQLLIFHAMANMEQRGGCEKNIKGSSYIKAAVDQLKSEGYSVAFVNFNRVPNTELKYYLLQADIIVDQLFFGWIGSLAREGLALGKPVVSYIRPEWQENYDAGRYGELPVIQCNQATLFQTLKDLVVDEKRRSQAGERGREFAIKYLDHLAIGRQLEEVYRGGKQP